MTRNEYFTKLNQALQFLSADIREATIHFYTEMLEDRMEDGQSEEEAVAAMENPDVIAQRLMSEMSESERSQDQAPNTDEVLTPRQLNFSKDEVRSLNVRLYDRKVRIHPTDGDLCIKYMENSKSPIEYALENGVLTLNQKPAATWTRHAFSLSALWDLLSGQNDDADITMDIFAPCNMLLDMFIHTSNVKITAEDLTGFGMIKLQTTNGKIVVNSVKCHALECQTTNGKIILTEIHSSKHMTARSTNGKIESSGVTSQGDVTLTTTNNSLYVNRISCSGLLHAGTTNGGITVDCPQANSILLSTTNGSIGGTLSGKQSDWRIRSRTSNGQNSLPNTQEGEKSLEVRTTNGHIRLEFEQH